MSARPIPRQTIISLLVAVLVAASAACGGDSPTAPAPIAGTFILRSFNGAQLPVDLGGGVALVGDTLMMSNNNAYRTTVVLESTVDGTTTQDAAGTYVRSGNSLIFTDNSDGSKITGSIDGASVTVVDHGNTYIFRM